MKTIWLELAGEPHLLFHAADRGCPCRKPHPAGDWRRIGWCYRVMMDLCRLIFWTFIDLMRARATLEAEIWVLRQQLNVLRRSSPKRQSFGTIVRGVGRVQEGIPGTAIGASIRGRRRIER
jgi:hypothetical protein